LTTVKVVSFFTFLHDRLLINDSKKLGYRKETAQQGGQYSVLAKIWIRRGFYA